MIKNIIEKGLLLTSFAFLTNSQSQSLPIKINEIYVDSERDSEEYVELYNPSAEPVNLKGYILKLIDTTPESFVFLKDTIIEGNGFYVIQNPPGAQNNSGQIILYDSLSNIVDEVVYGNWTNSFAPEGKKIGIYDSISRFPDGTDNWGLAKSSKGQPNNELIPKTTLTAQLSNTNSIIVTVNPAPYSYILQSRTLGGSSWNNLATNLNPGTYLRFEETIKGKEGRLYRAKAID